MHHILIIHDSPLELFIGFQSFIAYVKFPVNSTGGEGIQCKSSWSPWNWESKEGIEGKGTIIFICYSFHVLKVIDLFEFLAFSVCIPDLYFMYCRIMNRLLLMQLQDLMIFLMVKVVHLSFCISLQHFWFLFFPN